MSGRQTVSGLEKEKVQRRLRCYSTITLALEGSRALKEPLLPFRIIVAPRLPGNFWLKKPFARVSRSLSSNVQVKFEPRKGGKSFLFLLHHFSQLVQFWPSLLLSRKNFQSRKFSAIVVFALGASLPRLLGGRCQTVPIFQNFPPKNTISLPTLTRRLFLYWQGAVWIDSVVWGLWWVGLKRLEIAVVIGEEEHLCGRISERDK